MKKLFRLNNNICDQILNEAQIHFTKNCSNRCPFCIDAFNNGVGNKKPDIDKIFLSVLNIKDKIDDITISGGEPMLYIDELLQLVRNIKRFAKLNVTVITSMPITCWTHKETFFEIIKIIDHLIISPQHYDQEIGDKIRGCNSFYNREKLFSEIPYKNKVSLTINVIKGYFNDKQDIIDNIKFFEKLGYSNFKLAEIFEHDDLYVSIEDLLGFKLPSPFSYGCSTKHFELSPYLGYNSNSDFTIKRCCFYKTHKQHASINDLLKILIRPFFAKKYFFCIIYEDGKIVRRWF